MCDARQDDICVVFRNRVPRFAAFRSFIRQLFAQESRRYLCRNGVLVLLQRIVVITDLVYCRVTCFSKAVKVRRIDEYRQTSAGC